MASQQTIAPGDRCFVLPLMQAATFNPMKLSRGTQQFEVSGVAHMTCYPNAFWEPAGSLLSGVYDDYGSVKLDDTPVNMLRLSDFARTLLTETFMVEPGANSVRELPVNFQAFMEAQTPDLFGLLTGKAAELESATWYAQLVKVWEHYEGVARDFRAFVADYDQRPRQLLHAIFHESAVDKLVAHAEAGAAACNQRSLFDSALDKARGFFKEEADLWFAADVFGRKLDAVGSFEALRYPTEFEAVGQLLNRFAAQEFDADTFFAKVKPWLDVRYFMVGLDALNLRLKPMVYAGQDYGNEIGQAFAEFAGAVCTKVTAARKQRYARAND